MSSYEYNHTMARANVPVKVYGVTWDGSSSTSLTRTDDAIDFADPVPYVAGATSYGSPFDNRMPWKGIQKVEDSEAGTLVEIPKFWYKLTQDGSALSIQIANQEMEGFSVSPAHMDRGDGIGERDVVYIGRYHCGNSEYKSVTGQLPKGSVTRSAARTAIHNLGTTVWQNDFAMRFTIWLLYIVEFADWNSQEKIGYGCGDNSSLQAVGDSDSMPYHTGTHYASRTTYGVGVQYRHIEVLWDNTQDYLDGCYYNSGMYLILDPANFSDSANGTLIGTPVDGFPTVLSLSSAVFPMFYPTTSGGSSSTYIPDRWYYTSDRPCICAGSYYSQSGNYGLFYMNRRNATDALAYVGTRLMNLTDTSSGTVTTIITFYIDGYECTAEAGMTWADWISSAYNTKNASVNSSNNTVLIPSHLYPNGEGIKYDDGSGYWISPVYASDTIISGTYYEYSSF